MNTLHGQNFNYFVTMPVLDEESDKGQTCPLVRGYVYPMD
jgi:hypothetical protein